LRRRLSCQGTGARPPGLCAPHYCRPSAYVSTRFAIVER
jgi:hypothetical protein